MKKLLFFSLLLCCGTSTNAQTKNLSLDMSKPVVSHRDSVAIDTTAFLLRAYIDAMSSNDFGMKRVDLGYWNQFTTHYWLTHDDNDGEYILSRMYGNQERIEVIVFPRDDGHGFKVNPTDKNAVLLLYEVSRLIYLRILLPDLECF